MRAEAQSLVAEAQLTNITRQKFKEAYDIHTAAIIERAEKQILLAKQARRLVDLLDDTPIVPGDAHPPYEDVEVAREILNDAELELRQWRPNVTPIRSAAGALGANAMPGRENIPPSSHIPTHSNVAATGSSNVSTMGHTAEEAPPVPPPHTEGSVTSRETGDYSYSHSAQHTQPPYPTEETSVDLPPNTYIVR